MSGPRRRNQYRDRIATLEADLVAMQAERDALKTEAAELREMLAATDVHLP